MLHRSSTHSNSDIRSKHMQARDGEWDDHRDEVAGIGYLGEGSSSTFECYYRAQELLESEDEWSEFMDSLRRALPVTFRINRGLHSPALVEQCLTCAHHLLEPHDRDLPYEHGSKVARPLRLPWCDAVQLGVDRVVLKSGRSQYVKEVREWLMYHCGNGSEKKYLSCY